MKSFQADIRAGLHAGMTRHKKKHGFKNWAEYLRHIYLKAKVAENGNS